MATKKLQKEKQLVDIFVRDNTAKDDKGKQLELIYLKSAPLYLVAVYENKERFLGRNILGRLLVDKQMQRSWSVLSRHINSDQGWNGLWREIVYIQRKAHEAFVSRTKEKNKFLQIEKRSKELADSITDSSLDLLVYRFFSDEVMNVLGITNWSSLDSLQQSNAASNLLKEWPSAPELLNELAIQAQKLATDATSYRVTERNTGARLYFVRSLCEYFNKTYKVKLYGTVANIASVVIKYKIDKSYVENAVKRP